MRDPWFPIASLLIVLLGVWLGIFGSLSTGFVLKEWQPLVGAGVAFVAAVIAFYNTTRTIKQSEELEEKRRTRKHAAVRALLSIALSQVTAYARRSSDALIPLLSKCEGEYLLHNTAPESIAESPPSEALKAIAEFIEYSDAANVSIVEMVVAWVQIHDSRVRGLVQRNRDPSTIGQVRRTEIEESIIDAASLYAGASASLTMHVGGRNNYPTQ
jgi:hypothetical protein